MVNSHQATGTHTKLSVDLCKLYIAIVCIDLASSPGLPGDLGTGYIDLLIINISGYII